MSVGSISDVLVANITSDPQGPTVNEMAALLDANNAQTSAALQLIQSVGQSEQSQVGPEPLLQNRGEGPGTGFSVYA